MMGNENPLSERAPTCAMVLAAGEGRRLRPLTENVSKCMVPINGKPLLEYNIDWLRSHGVTEIVINLHHAPQSVVNHFANGRRWSVNITYSHEPELLGTAGAVKRVAHAFSSAFFVCYGDNLSACRLDQLWRLHRARRGVATIALYHRDDPTTSGIVSLDSDDRILRFLEKPRAEEVFSNWVNAGIFVLEPGVLESIPDGVSDFGRDVFPRLLERGSELFGYRMSAGEGLWWIDTEQDLRRVQTEFEGRTAEVDRRIS